MKVGIIRAPYALDYRDISSKNFIIPNFSTFEGTVREMVDIFLQNRSIVLRIKGRAQALAPAHRWSLPDSSRIS